MVLNSARELSVEADMERIFGPADRSSAARDLAAPWSPPRLPALRRQRSGFGRWIAFGVLGTLIVSLGFLVDHGDVGRTALVPKVQAVTPPPLVSRIGPAVQTAVQPAVVPSPGTVQVVASAAVKHRIAPASRSIPPAIDRDLAPTVMRHATTAISTTPSDEDRDHAGQLAADRSGDACAHGEENDACIYQDVIAADRRLRGAYADAMRYGAPRGELRSIQRRWQQARDISLAEPDETIRRYDHLTDELAGQVAMVPR